MIGIIQGRLSIAPKNRLQFFPKKWESEFKIAKDSGYDYIEFFSERKFNKNNPIWNNNLLKIYLKLAKKNNLKIYSFIDDFIISNSILNKKNIYYLKKLIKNLSRIKVKKLILPLYGKSAIKSENINSIIKSLDVICNYASRYKVNILIESNIEPETFFKIKIFLKKKIYLVIDTGNRINLNRNIYNDIVKLNKNIKHIHIKDKNNLNENVILGKGNVDFKKLKIALTKIKYTGNYTIESTRANNPIRTAKRNLNYLKNKLFNS